MNSTSSLADGSNLLAYLRSGTSVSLQGHLGYQPQESGKNLSASSSDKETKKYTASMLPARSAKLLLSRGPSYPAMSLDLSQELCEENLMRRSIHSSVMSTNPGVFRRLRSEESPSTFQTEAAKVQNLLGTMHPYKDYGDISPHRSFSRSRIIEQTTRQMNALEEKKFNELKPLEDFVRPEEQTIRRQTGYNSGHVRSLFKLDTFGPGSSQLTALERASTPLPLPNMDRFAVLRRPGSSGSVGSSRASTSQSNRPISPSPYAGDNNSVDSSSLGGSVQSILSKGKKKFSSHKEVKIAPSLRSLFLETGATGLISDKQMTMTVPSSLRKDYQTGDNMRITPEDRNIKDPFVRRKYYNKKMKDFNNMTKEQRRFETKIQKYHRQQQELATIERNSIKEFERCLALAKFES